eukprot:4362379-Amphidinium_carterae.1
MKAVEFGSGAPSLMVNWGKASSSSKKKALAARGDEAFPFVLRSLGNPPTFFSSLQVKRRRAFFLFLFFVCSFAAPFRLKKVFFGSF